MVSFVSFPPEVLILVIRQVSSQSDLSKLSKTCKTLKTIVFPILYSQLVLKIPRTWMRLSHLENLLKSTSEGLQHVTSLRITISSYRHLKRDEEEFLENVNVLIIRGGVCEPNVLLDTHLNALVRILLGRLPRRRLTEFIWDHPSIMNHATLNSLAEAHNRGLTILKFNRLSQDETDCSTGYISNLRNFAFDSMDNAIQGCELVSTILFEHSKTLRYLSLGAEHTTVWDYEDPEDISDDDMDYILGATVHDLQSLAQDMKIDLANTPLLTLDTLVLKGLNASELIKPDFLFQDWTCLKTLVLESCRGLEQALALLADTKDMQGQPLRSVLRLDTIQVRCEGPSHVTQLNHFLASIAGLVNLSVLLESPDNSRTFDFKAVLKSHGKSLKTLVWEERTGRREAFVGSPNHKLPTVQQLETIAKCCPNLMELGLPMNWEAITGYWERERIRRALSPLNHLRTLNIRNSPSFDPKMTDLSVEDMHAGYVVNALKTLDRTPGTMLSERPGTLRLRTLAIGSFTYQDLHDRGHEHNEDPALQRFLRPQIYNVDTWSLRSGQQRTFATLTETSKYDVTEATVGNVEVLKPYWLG